MIIWVLLAVFCYGLIEDDKFTVTKCNNDDDRPELTFTIDKDYFNLNLYWQADQVDFEIKCEKGYFSSKPLMNLYFKPSKVFTH